MDSLNRQWLLAKRPVGMIRESDFELVEAEIAKPKAGQVLLKTRWLSFEPAMRGWVRDRDNYMPPVAIGEVMRGMAVSEVMESNLEGFAVGDLVSGMTGWQEWSISGPGLRKLAPDEDPCLALSVMGLTGLTAYVGLLDIGAAKEGDVVVVSGAAGSTGSIVGQIAKRKGCRVIGIAGGPEKCAWLTGQAHFDDAIDYKNEDLGARLDALCPEGIDLYFDNVGGETLDAALARIARGARVVICGAIASYNDEELPPGPRNYYRVVAQRGTIRGFVVMDHFKRLADATADLTSWVEDGSISWKVDVQHDFKNVPKTLLRLYSGANFGKQLLEL